MIDPENVPAVADNELLARFIVYSDEKSEDGTVAEKQPSWFWKKPLHSVTTGRSDKAFSFNYHNFGDPVMTGL